ncbi:THUMP domain-containing protein 3 [Harpegnathos saltator]|uniref:THUMP domain-containing protein 3 n=1 Tax=Harpegnathos saltator TaxID=610380 RepID=E2BBL2_HARSA|nr:THUMP domain-containing protein 3 [Harpegnathos saltator]
MDRIKLLFDESLSKDDAFMICATVDTGFEWQAIDEHREKVSNTSEPVKERGKIYFNLQWDQYEKVQEMRSIDNILIVADVRTFTFHDTDKEADKEANLELFKDAVQKHMNLNKALDMWKRVACFMGEIYPTLEEYNSAKEQAAVTTVTEPVTEAEPETTKGRKRGVDPSESKEGDILKFRVTCERSGNHTFESTDVACVVGGELQTKYHWIVDLSKYHLEVICKLIEQQLITLLRVTHESKHRRNIVSFGPTTLRSTICYNLLRLANPKPGDIVIDPMCGSGSIPIEAALAFSHLCILCGDKNSKAVERTKSNIDGSETAARILFGKRSGKKSNNERLYKQFLLELGRVVKLRSGRLVLLTHDRRSFNYAFRAAGDLFQLMRAVNVKIGGLQVIAYVLKRTNVPLTSFKPRYY